MNLHPAIVFALMGLFCSSVALFGYWRVRTWQKLVKPDDPFYTITDVTLRFGIHRPQ